MPRCGKRHAIRNVASVLLFVVLLTVADLSGSLVLSDHLVVREIKLLLVIFYVSHFT